MQSTFIILSCPKIAIHKKSIVMKTLENNEYKKRTQKVYLPQSLVPFLPNIKFENRCCFPHFND